MKSFVVIGLINLALSGALPAYASNGIPAVFHQASKAHGVPVRLYWAIALQESGAAMKSGRFLPWPWTLNLNGVPRRHLTREAAYQELSQFLAKGHRNADIGWVQVSWRWNADQFTSPWDALDPIKNVAAGARILRDCYDRFRDWWKAAACYHVGPDVQGKAAAAKSYIAAVSRKYRKLTEQNRYKRKSV